MPAASRLSELALLAAEAARGSERSASEQSSANFDDLTSERDSQREMPSQQSENLLLTLWCPEALVGWSLSLCALRVTQRVPRILRH